MKNLPKVLCRILFASSFVLFATSCRQSLSETRLLEVDSEEEQPILSLAESYYDNSYDSRYSKIAFLASNFNVEIKSDPYGLWAGIMHQTRWQQKTKRDHISQWRFVNTTLTIEPYYYGREFEQPNPNCENVQIIEALQDPSLKQGRIKDCRAWFQYFAYVKSSSPQQNQAQQLMWKAHSQSITTARERFRVSFSYGANDIPIKEYQFWKGWIDLVYLLEEANFPTTDFGTKLISNSLLPPCGPIAAGSSCDVSNFSFSQRKLAEMFIEGQLDSVLKFMEALK